MKLYAGVEAGGTKFVCAVGNGEGEIYDRVSLPTTTPDETIPQLIEFLSHIKHKGTLAAIGIGSFGPIDTHTDSDTYGFITSTPKTAWINCDIVSPFKHHFNLPIGFATDVATAALGEYRWGAGQGLSNFLYMTVGTGIGAASIINGEVLHGMGHQEIGHMLIPHDKKLDPFKGMCPYHHDCLEGLACGGAIKERWHVNSALDLPADHLAWDLEADYLATALANCLLTSTPERIILGGGVMRQMHLFPKIRAKVLQKLNGYISEPALLEHIDDFIVPPGLSDRAGVAGAIALAKQADVKPAKFQ
jgi:fructokinase